MNGFNRKMTEKDIHLIVNELERWADGQLGSKLTWAKLEERFSFSRQSLQSKRPIKIAYDHAKKSLSGGLVKSRKQSKIEKEDLIRKITKLELENERLRTLEKLWQRRWQEIAYHIRNLGIQMTEVDKRVQEKLLPSKSRTSQILKPFKKAIPPSGRI